MTDLAGRNEETRLIEESVGPFGSYYVHPAKRTRSQELRTALAALKPESFMEYERRTR